MNGIIYNKKTTITPRQGTGDNCLILEPRTSYQAPFTFGSDWEVIRLGVIWSCSSVTGEDTNDDTRYNTPITDTTDGQSGVILFENASDDVDLPRNNSWYGVIQNNNLNTFPKDDGTTSFLGYNGTKINFSSDDADDYVRERRNHLSPSVGADYAVLQFWQRHNLRGNRYIINSSAIESELNNGTQYSNTAIAPKIYGLKNPRSSGISPEAEENFASFWGIQIEKSVINGINGGGRWRYTVNNCYYNESLETLENGGGNHQYSSGCKITDCGANSLLNILDGFGLQSGIYPGGRYRGENFNVSMRYAYNEEELQEANEIYSPNALFFYNSFTGLNMRIHSHAVVKMK